MMSHTVKTVKITLLMSCLCLFSGCYNSVNTITYQHIASCPVFAYDDRGGAGPFEIYAIYGIANSPVQGTSGSDFTFLLQNVHAGNHGPTPATPGGALDIMTHSNCDSCFLPVPFQFAVGAGQSFAVAPRGYALIAIQTDGGTAPTLWYDGTALMVELDSKETKYGSPLSQLQLTNGPDGSLLTTVMPRASAYLTDAASF